MDKTDISFLTGNDISGSFSMEKDESDAKERFHLPHTLDFWNT